MGVIVAWNHSRHSQSRPPAVTEVPAQVAPGIVSAPAITDSTAQAVNYVLDHVTLEQLLSSGTKYSLSSDGRPRSSEFSTDSTSARDASALPGGQGQIRAVTF